jgi:hypothetical protein
MTSYLQRLLGVTGLALLALSLGTMAQSAPGQTTETSWDRYIWQVYRSSNIPPSASNLVTELRSEIDKILRAGPLAPIRTVYADLEQDPYFMYWQGGRIVTTLAMAWPHLTASEQEGVRSYVRRELQDASRAPWTARGFIPPDQGSRRELHPFHEARGWDRYWAMWGKKKPVMGSFYGLWLYGDRSGDWDTLRTNYAQLADLYRLKAAQCDLYGTMGAHIAMARIARHFEDRPLMLVAINNAIDAFQVGTNFDKVEAATVKYWKERYEPRQNGLVYEGWMFLDLCPEVGRYLADYVKADTLARHRQGLSQYPLFWLREVPYWSRWTGDEGLGIPTELMGMIVPVERWVAQVPAATLARYTRSAPICLGDCYWIEALILAIEATGETRWKSGNKFD